MTIEPGLSGIPVSEASPHSLQKLYCEEHYNIGEAYAQFAFCKDLNTLHAAAENLKKQKSAHRVLFLVDMCVQQCRNSY